MGRESSLSVFFAGDSVTRALSPVISHQFRVRVRVL